MALQTHREIDLIPNRLQRTSTFYYHLPLDRFQSHTRVYHNLNSALINRQFQEIQSIIQEKKIAAVSCEFALNWGIEYETYPIGLFPIAER